MFRFIKIFVIIYIIFFIMVIIMSEGKITGSMIGATAQVSVVNTILWCILKPRFTK